ncbi:MAG: GNAT family N-acetyltransferase [Gammaproteobacteria bacterium]
MQVEWQWSCFDELTTHDLYEVLKLRQAVFVVEQDCAYQDVDDVDQSAWHLLGWQRPQKPNRELVAYLRLVFPGIKYPEPSIGRVLTAASARRRGLGMRLTQEALVQATREYPGQSLRISAQQYLADFYKEVGFQIVSEPYDEDGIPHVEMVRMGDLVEGESG